MEFILKLKTKFDLIYKINNLKRKIEKDSFQTMKLNIENNENFVINIEPITEKDKLLFPYNIYVNCVNNNLVFESPNIEVLNYKNVYVLDFLCLEAVRDMRVLLSENNYSVFNTYTTNITTSSGTIKLPNLYNNVSQEKFANFTILTFEGVRPFCNVLLNNEIIFSDYYSDIKKSNKSIEILTELDDIAKHCIITKIEGKNISKTTVYKYASPKLVYSNKLIPLALLQALKVNNEKLCKHYLSGNLKDIATLNTLKSFFGDYKKFELDGDNIVLFYKENDKFTHKTYKFIINDNKINHIDVF